MNAEDPKNLPDRPDLDLPEGDIVATVDFPDGTPSLRLDRRDFLRLASAASAAAALASAGCRTPAENVIPASERPEAQQRVGKPLFYATTLAGRPALVRTREGRPILVGPNPKHPVVTTPSLESQAQVLELYDPDRARSPQSVRRGKGLPVAATWESVGAQVLAAARARKGRIVLLGRPESGPGTLAAIDAFCQAFGAEYVPFSVADDESWGRACVTALGTTRIPTPRFDRAKLVVGLGADFLDRPVGDEALHFSATRTPDASGGMSRFVAFEGRLSLTGANADTRLRVRPSDLPRLAVALAREVIAVRKVGPWADQPAFTAPLLPFELGTVARDLGLDVAVLSGIVDALVSTAGSNLVVTGEGACAQPGGQALAMAVLLLNLSLGNWGTTLDPSAPREVATGSLARLVALVADMKAGKVDLLLVHGVNPVFHAPASIGFAEAMAAVPLVVSLNDRIDETSALADWLAPASHPLECWGDVRWSDRVLGLQQPALRPLHDTRGFLDVLVSWGAARSGGGDLAVALQAARDQGTRVAPVHSPAWTFLRSAWQRDVYPRSGASVPFDRFWNDGLRDGFVTLPGEIPAAPDLNPGALALLSEAPARRMEGLELQVFPHYALGEGTFGNNGWLHEFADPITRISWSDWVAVAPRRFDAMGLRNGDLLEVSIGAARLTLPAYRQAGMHEDVVAIPSGLGRERVGLVGEKVGSNVFTALPVEDGRPFRSGLSVTIKATGRHVDLPFNQGSEVIDRKARPLLPATTLAAWTAEPRAGTEQTKGGASAYKDHPYTGQRWAMAIDLSRCNGCGLCTLACRGENNIPVVGKQGVTDRREMSWLRIDRYYDVPGRTGEWPDSVWDGPLEVVEEPRTLFEPMMCQHCENATCETVCPFAATMHSADGLNQQVYNRCVGTFFCANNCPFKVRRFNWYDYSTPRTNAFFSALVPIMRQHAVLNARDQLQMKNNPEVTVRSRGVMEKCSFCIQRIREARELATNEGRDPDLLQDGEVKPACMEACPTGAIVFGNVNDPTSRVAALSANPRAMKLLELLNVRPSVSYLTKVRNEG